MSRLHRHGLRNARGSGPVRAAYFEHATQHARDVILLMDEDGQLFECNEAALEAYGYARDEFLRLNVRALRAPETLSVVVDDLRKAGTVEGYTFETVHLRKDGSAFPVEVGSSLLSFDGTSYRVSIIRDIGARKAAEREREKIEARIVRLNATLVAVNRIAEQSFATKERRNLYQFACDALVGIGDIAGVWIGEKMPDFTIKPVACTGITLEALSAFDFRWDDSEAGRKAVGEVVRTRIPVTIENTGTDARFAPFSATLREAGVISIAVVPIVFEADVLGSLAIWSRKPEVFGESTVHILAQTANGMATAMHSLELSGKLSEGVERLRIALNSTIAAIATMLEFRDPYTADHERNVAELSQAIGIEMGLSQTALEGLRVIGYLHDVGKISVPAEILSKPGNLTEIEFAMVKTHSEVGYEILKGLKFPWPVAQAVLQHHERLDGSGYPQGLKGDKIIFEARILAVADVVEAMSSHRPYRPALGVERALEEITRNRGRFYDSAVADACIALISSGRFKFASRRATAESLPPAV